jgi:hypothetical protein
VRKLQLWVVLIFSLALLAGGVGSPKAGTPRGTQGSYDLTFASCYTGTGNGVVAAKSVTIIGHVTDVKTGASGTLVASNLALYDGRFSGTGSFSGSTVSLSGRIQAADGKLVKTPCIFCNLSTSNSEYGRLLGQRKGP